MSILSRYEYFIYRTHLNGFILIWPIHIKTLLWNWFLFTVYVAANVLCWLSFWRGAPWAFSVLGLSALQRRLGLVFSEDPTCYCFCSHTLGFQLISAFSLAALNGVLVVSFSPADKELLPHQPSISLEDSVFLSLWQAPKHLQVMSKFLACLHPQPSKWDGKDIREPVRLRLA